MKNTTSSSSAPASRSALSAAFSPSMASRYCTWIKMTIMEENPAPLVSFSFGSGLGGTISLQSS
nr:hypothetical protein Iba_chr14eCG0710 [Ipomoea batatas]GME20316.1 hypothetical protein Iba_scaffold24828CG0010 [Ipomoea batatas]